MPRRPPEPHDPVRDAVLRDRFQRTGIVMLIAGLAVAILILLLVHPDTTPANFDQPSLSNSKVYEQTIEHMGGKSAVLGVEIGDWWSSLWHGRHLAYTLATVSLAGAGVCFFFSYLLGLPPRSD